MKKPSLLITIFAATFGIAAPLVAQTTTNFVSDPLGFNSVPCPIESDTILAVPFRPNGSLQGALDATAIIDNRPGEDTATLTLAGTPGFDPVGDPVINDSNGEFANTHYARFSVGNSDGRAYRITANGTNTLTIDLNGDNLPSAVENDTLTIAAYWTLDTLFPPADANIDPTLTGHAIVASTNPFARATEVLLPNRTRDGINSAPNQTFYIWEGVWYKFGAGSTNFGAQQIDPDSYIIIRHSDVVTSPTTFKCSGEVELGTMSIPLRTRGAGEGPQDNFIGILRPVDVFLDDLGLVPGAFEASGDPFDRTDELLVFDNINQAYNKSAAATYYYWAGGWRKFGGGSTDVGAIDKIPAGGGFIIRKAEKTTASTVFWNNPPNYDNQP